MQPILKLAQQNFGPDAAENLKGRPVAYIRGIFGSGRATIIAENSRVAVDFLAKLGSC